MNILITGNTGFLGRHLVKTLAAQNYYDMGGSEFNDLFFINSNDKNLLEPLYPPEYANRLNAVPAKVDKIYHLATYIKAGTYPLHHKADIWEKNMLMQAHIISYWLHHQPQATFVGIGTSCAYPLGLPLIEKNYLRGEVDPDMAGYASTKRAAFQGLQCIHEQYGLNFQYFIPPTLNGDDFSNTDTHFNFDFIRKICDAKFNGKECVFWGDGSQIREIMDVDDVVKVLLNCDIKNKPVNISRGNAMMLSEYAKIICQIVDYDYNKIIWDTTKWIGNNISKLLVNTQLKYVNWLSEESSLRKAVEWYINENFSHTI